MSISFWAQNEMSRARAAAANDRLFNDTSVSKLFTSGNPSASSVPSVLTQPSPYAVVNGFGQAYLNHSMSQALMAAQAGNERVKQETAAALGNNTNRPAGDLSSQVAFSGALKVDFGKDGPAAGGAYRFVSGSDLKTNFKVAFGGKMSDGEAIDTVSIVGNTMTGSTSGPNAHDVFTLTLHPDTGLFNFQLVGPIDQSNKKGSFKTIYLQSLMQATSSTGQKKSVPTVQLDVYNDYGPVQSQGLWAVMHEGSLTYKDPAMISATVNTPSTDSTSTGPAKPAPYTAPTDPRTGRSYTTSTSASLSVINSVNIFS